MWYDVLVGANGFLLITKFLGMIPEEGYLGIGKRVRVFFRAMLVALSDVVYFMFTLTLIFFALGTFAFMLFMGELGTFRDIRRSFTQMFISLVDELPFDEMKSNPTGPTFFFFYTPLMSLVLANVFIAIFSETYAGEMEELEDNSVVKNWLQVYNLFSGGWKDLLPDASLLQTRVDVSTANTSKTATELNDLFDVLKKRERREKGKYLEENMYMDPKHTATMSRSQQVEFLAKIFNTKEHLVNRYIRFRNLESTKYEPLSEAELEVLNEEEEHQMMLKGEDFTALQMDNIAWQVRSMVDDLDVGDADERGRVDKATNTARAERIKEMRKTRKKKRKA